MARNKQAPIALMPKNAEQIRVKIPDATINRLVAIEGQIAALQARHSEVLMTAIEGQGYTEGAIAGFDAETKEVLLSVAKGD